MDHDRYQFGFRRAMARQAIDAIRPLWASEGKSFAAGVLELILREIKARRSEIDALKRKED